MASHIGRRKFLPTLLGGAAAAWPLAARAQQAAMPVIGFLDSRTPDTIGDRRLRAFRQALNETGFVEGENVAILYRWADNQLDRLPDLATDLVRRQVAVIAATGSSRAALAAKAATSAIPIVFAISEDPIGLGLVASVARPGGNATGINFLTTELTAKRLQLLRELVPAATRVAVLVNPNNPNAEATLREVAAAGRAMGMEIAAFKASTSQEIDAAFASFDRPHALFVGGDGFFVSRRVQLTSLANRHGIPAIFSPRDFAEAGGLITYGSDILDSYRQVGVYSGRILKGAKPADLPVVQSTKFELVIYHLTARVLSLTVPTSLLASADEVIE